MVPECYNVSCSDLKASFSETRTVILVERQQGVYGIYNSSRIVKKLIPHTKLRFSIRIVEEMGEQSYDAKWIADKNAIMQIKGQFSCDNAKDFSSKLERSI